jgi:hypothetical protein
VENIAVFAISLPGTSPAKAELVQQADIGLLERLPLDTDTDDYARVTILQTEAGIGQRLRRTRAYLLG